MDDERFPKITTVDDERFPKITTVDDERFPSIATVDDERFPNIMTVDVEDWFHILEVDGGFTRRDWDGLEARVVANTDRILGLFDEAGVHATFFVVGWVARRQPAMVRRIAEAGHEIGSHSYWHEVLPRHDARSLAADLTASRKLLEDLGGSAVTGFRAPGGSITPAQAWAFDVMLDAGYHYDSSLCPGYSSHGGYPSPYLGPHRLRCERGLLDEVPSATIGLAGRRVPYAGGGYLRLFPYALQKWATRLENRNGRPSSVYVHPREIDPEQPRMDLPALRSFKYYVGLSGAESKLRRLLRDFRWLGARDWLDAHREALADQVLDVRAAAAAAPPEPDPALVPPAPEPA
jgi:polysaccharide deacetylase family protein (PEP-CTERM system associated)